MEYKTRLKSFHLGKRKQVDGSNPVSINNIAGCGRWLSAGSHKPRSQVRVLLPLQTQSDLG